MSRHNTIFPQKPQINTGNMVQEVTRPFPISPRQHQDPALMVKAQQRVTQTYQRQSIVPPDMARIYEMFERTVNDPDNAELSEVSPFLGCQTDTNQLDSLRREFEKIRLQVKTFVSNEVSVLKAEVSSLKENVKTHIKIDSQITSSIRDLIKEEVSAANSKSVALQKTLIDTLATSIDQRIVASQQAMQSKYLPIQQIARLKAQLTNHTLTEVKNYCSLNFLEKSFGKEVLEDLEQLDERITKNQQTQPHKADSEASKGLIPSEVQKSLTTTNKHVATLQQELEKMKDTVLNRPSMPLEVESSLSVLGSSLTHLSSVVTEQKTVQEHLSSRLRQIEKIAQPPETKHGYQIDEEGLIKDLNGVCLVDDKCQPIRLSRHDIARLQANELLAVSL